MRLTLGICTAPVLAGLLCTLVACSEGTKSGGNTNGGGGSGAAGGDESTSPAETGGTKAEGGAGGVSSSAVNTTPGAAGSSAVSGTGGSSGGSYIKCWDFADSKEKWAKNYAQVFLLEDPTQEDKVNTPLLLANTKAEWVASEGYGKVPGVVELEIPYLTQQTKYQGVEFSYISDPPLTNLRGRTLHAFVNLVSGMTADDKSNPSGAKLVVKSGADFFYADGGWVNLGKNDWIELMLDVSKPTNVDAAKDISLYNADDIREIAIAIQTSGSATTVVSPGIIKVDHICY